jgi:hypothetical protein
MPWAIVDVDGVLADVRHRLEYVSSRPKDWDGFFAAAPRDAVLPQGLKRCLELAAANTVIYLTGRPERCRTDTVEWLRLHGFPDGDIVMRPDVDRRPARLFKLNQARRLARRDDVAVIVDDDEAVVDTLRAEGFTVEHATWMHDEEAGLKAEAESEQAALFDAQEREGRT